MYKILRHAGLLFLMLISVILKVMPAYAARIIKLGSTVNQPYFAPETSQFKVIHNVFLDKRNLPAICLGAQWEAEVVFGGVVPAFALGGYDKQPVILRLLKSPSMGQLTEEGAGFVLAYSYADPISARIMMRLSKVSWIDAKSGKAFEASVDGFVIGDDHQYGLKIEDISHEDAVVGHERTRLSAAESGSAQKGRGLSILGGTKLKLVFTQSPVWDKP